MIIIPISESHMFAGEGRKAYNLELKQNKQKTLGKTKDRTQELKLIHCPVWRLSNTGWVHFWSWLLSCAGGLRVYVEHRHTLSFIY